MKNVGDTDGFLADGAVEGDSEGFNVTETVGTEVGRVGAAVGTAMYTLSTDTLHCDDSTSEKERIRLAKAVQAVEPY